jgi:hypothetical protein
MWQAQATPLFPYFVAGISLIFFSAFSAISAVNYPVVVWHQG